MLAVAADTGGNRYNPYSYTYRLEEATLTPLLPSPVPSRVTPAPPLLPPRARGANPVPNPSLLGRASRHWSMSSHHGQHPLLLSPGNPFPYHQQGAQHGLGRRGQLYIIQRDYKNPSIVAKRQG